MSNVLSLPWSEHQLAIFSAVERGDRNLIINAVAGSGKTTTILGALDHTPRGDSILPLATTFLAFNKGIAETLQKRVPRGVSCSTFHSLGFRALKRHLDNPKVTNAKDFVNSRKVFSHVMKFTTRDNEDLRNIVRLISLAKSTLNPTFFDLIERYEIDFVNPTASAQIAQRAFEKSISDLSSIDFDDMLFLPVLLNAEFDEQDWVFVDEAQDVNDIQLEILQRLQRPGRPGEARQETGTSIIKRNYLKDPTYCPYCMRCSGPERMTLVEPLLWDHHCGAVHDEREQKGVSPTRFVFVGDPHQAIYAFRGANADSMERIARRFSCESLPLSVSWRCPRLVVEEAQKYCTKIQ